MDKKHEGLQRKDDNKDDNGDDKDEMLMETRKHQELEALETC